ncbi:heme peroxidase family protein [Roseobacter sp. OBYS 0001]|uniref:peroxidase family protein n=1 Tax=Roseobacter sp. OBYS 0001 TaxID=882651 RepID=UPI001BBB42F1|nr:heme peroxidase family protein [Roseobacter sp. OBYS 0001]GIT88880.1 myeloperoxidase [Roseobacter sp. OBYS 0001]
MSPEDITRSSGLDGEVVLDKPKATLTQSHGTSTRALTTATLNGIAANGDPGKFGRMFGDLPALIVDDAPLIELAEAMVDNPPSNPSGDNRNIPAGFTYLGQFVDHDITLDTTPLSDQMADPTATRNFRTPALDLDSLYGQSQGIDPQLYARISVPPYGPTNKFLIGKTMPSPNEGLDSALPNDLPRNQVGRAVIGDERNDENLAIAQTHLAFLKFHNKVIDHLSVQRPELNGAEQFQEARRIVTWHYQWIVLFDFVERLTEPGLVRKIMHKGRRFYRFEKTPFMPAEFSAAAYRLGHSMIREQYDFNRVFREGGLTPASLALLFGFTGKSGAIVGELVDDPSTLPTPGIPGGKLPGLPGNWIIDWRRFYDLDPDLSPNATRLIDTKLAPMLANLPGERRPEAILAFRNLRRGSQLGLPSGQAVANAIGVKSLTPEEVATGPAGTIAKKHGLNSDTPLWFYVLKEAEVIHGGVRLGPVGSTIIAETFLGLVHGDHNSFLWQRKNWTPELPSSNPDTFTMADLLRFVDDINPIGKGT